MRQTLAELDGISELCNGCGTCAGICPDGIVEMRKIQKGVYVPSFKSSSCRLCGLCVKVCPGISEDLSKSIYNKAPKDHVLLGNYINCYIGHSMNRNIRYNSASGGLATTLVNFLLDEGKIDGALVTRMCRSNPLEPEAFIARTKKEVISASKTKYCPVPLNKSISYILNNDGSKFAIVGLPCHIQGIRKAEMVDKRLKEKVILRIGLFCGHTVNFLGTEFLLHRMGIRIKDVAEISYRGKGWPGYMTVKLKNGDERSLPYFLYWIHFFASFFFTPIRCTLCSDGTNELADISLGDAWLPELAESSIGESILITRTKTGENFAHEALLKGRIRITKIKSEKVLQAQREMLYFKKKNLQARASFLKLLGRHVPSYNSKLPKQSFMAHLSAILPYLSIYASSKQITRKLLRYVPLPVLNLYKLCVTTLMCM